MTRFSKKLYDRIHKKLLAAKQYEDRLTKRLGYRSVDDTGSYVVTLRWDEARALLNEITRLQCIVAKAKGQTK